MISTEIYIDRRLTKIGFNSVLVEEYTILHPLLHSIILSGSVFVCVGIWIGMRVSMSPNARKVSTATYERWSGDL